jgi:hypothetical protein
MHSLHCAAAARQEEVLFRLLSKSLETALHILIHEKKTPTNDLLQLIMTSKVATLTLTDISCK